MSKAPLFSRYMNPQKMEIYLRQQHQQGQDLKAIKGFSGKLTMVATTPEDVLYRLDYYQAKGGSFSPEYDQDYRNLFADAGWEFVAASMPYVVFRKPASQASRPEDLVLYSDRESLHRYHQKVLWTQLTLFLIPVLQPLFQMLVDWATGEKWQSKQLIFLTILALCYAAIASYFIKSYRQKIQRETL